MNSELNKLVMLERVEMIARLTNEGMCHERDREIALNLIAELAGCSMLKSNDFSVSFSVASVNKTPKNAGL